MLMIKGVEKLVFLNDSKHCVMTMKCKCLFCTFREKEASHTNREQEKLGGANLDHTKCILLFLQ